MNLIRTSSTLFASRYPENPEDSKMPTPLSSFFAGKVKDNLMVRLYVVVAKALRKSFIHYRTKSRQQEDGKTVCLSAVFALPIALFFLLIVRQHDLYAQGTDSCKISLPAIAAIESSNRPHAVGDGGKALGLYQIHPAVFEEFNKANKTRYRHHSHALEPITATLIADWYLHVRIPQILRWLKEPITRDSVLTCWNMGCGAVKKGRVAKGYIAKYRAIAEAA